MKRFETTLAVDHVDLSVDEAEVRGLLGPNGAGKTTLLRLLFGLVRADAGSVELFGRPLDAADPASLDGVSGFVEDPDLLPLPLGTRESRAARGAGRAGGRGVASTRCSSVSG